jgi:hypothetical protein
MKGSILEDGLLPQQILVTEIRQDKDAHHALPGREIDENTAIRTSSRRIEREGKNRKAARYLGLELEEEK